MTLCAFSKRLRAEAARTEREQQKLERDVMRFCERMAKKHGRSVLVLAVQKGGGSIFGQEFVSCGISANGDGSIDCIDELMAECAKDYRERLDEVKKNHLFDPARRKSLKITPQEGGAE